MKKIIFFDCDGVLTIDGSSWLVLHRYFGSIDNSYFAELYDKGLITYLDWMKIDVALMINSWGQRITKRDVIEALKSIRVRNESVEVVKLLKQRGYIIGVISSGIGLLVKRICKEIGADICLYNELLFYNNELIPGGKAWVPLKEKPEIIKYVYRSLGISKENTIYVGDSKWDIPVFNVVGKSIIMEPCSNLCSYADHSISSLYELLEILN